MCLGMRFTIKDPQGSGQTRSLAEKYKDAPSKSRYGCPVCLDEEIVARGI